MVVLLYLISYLSISPLYAMLQLICTDLNIKTNAIFYIISQWLFFSNSKYFKFMKLHFCDKNKSDEPRNITFMVIWVYGYMGIC